MKTAWFCGMRPKNTLPAHGRAQASRCVQWRSWKSFLLAMCAWQNLTLSTSPVPPCMSSMNYEQYTDWAPSSCTLQLGCTAKVCAEGSTPWASPGSVGGLMGSRAHGGHQTSAVLLSHSSALLPGWAPCSLHLPLGWETPRWGWAAPKSPGALPALRRPWQALPDCDNRHNNSQESPSLWSQLMEFHPPATAFLEHLILHCQLVDSINYDKWDEVPQSW